MEAAEKNLLLIVGLVARFRGELLDFLKWRTTEASISHGLQYCMWGLSFALQY